MSTIKQQRTAEQIKIILSDLFLQKLKDPRLQILTIMEVVIDSELQYADVYITALGDDSRQDDVMSALKKAGSFLRRELAPRLALRTVPRLHFHWDSSLKQAAHIHSLLDNLNIPPEPNPGTTSETTLS